MKVIHKKLRGNYGPLCSRYLRSSIRLLVCHRAAVELQQEAKSHVLNHVNIVKLYGIVFEPRHYGVVLEYVPHGGLDEYLFQNKVTYVHFWAPRDRNRKCYRIKGTNKRVKCVTWIIVTHTATSLLLICTHSFLFIVTAMAVKAVATPTASHSKTP